MQIGDVCFMPFEDQPGWLVTATGNDPYATEKQARSLNEAGTTPGYYAICGALNDTDDFHRLYLVPAGDPGAVAEAFGVGSGRGFYSADDPGVIRAEIEAIHAHCPIVPFFADVAGFKFGFQGMITPELLRLIDQTLTVGIEAMVEASYEAGGEGEPSAFVRREEHVHLWWD